MRSTKRLTTENFIERSDIIHNNKYNYSLVNYKNNKTKVKIICSEHGIFEQRPDDHLKGCGCAICSGNVMTTEMFIDKSKKIHGDKYDYSLVDYKKYKIKVEIVCSKHGVFKQTPYHHMIGCGCQVCNESKGERDIKKILDKCNILYEYQKTFEGCRYKRLLPFDFYLKEYNTCIEYDGLQHDKPISTWGGDEYFNIVKKRYKIKNNYCEKNNIKMLRIKYNENIKDKLDIILNNSLSL